MKITEMKRSIVCQFNLHHFQNNFFLFYPPLVCLLILINLTASSAQDNPSLSSNSPQIENNVSHPFDDELHLSSAKKVYGLVMSPFCPGRLLSDCPSAQADSLKEEILDQVRKGLPDEDIIKALTERYGEGIRAMPTATGIGLVAWVIPPAFFAAALTLGVVWLRRKKVQS